MQFDILATDSPNVSTGVAAKEVHVCGHECAIELVKRIAETAGDTVEVQRGLGRGKVHGW